jgi:hypothetical protein
LNSPLILPFSSFNSYVQAIKGITAKFIDIFEGPFIISKISDHSAYELKDEKGKMRGEFNKKQLKRYKDELEVN